MFVVGLASELACDPPITGDGVSALIEAVIDELDALVIEPSIETAGVGEKFRMTVEVIVDTDDVDDAVTQAHSAIRSAFHTAGIGTAGMVRPTTIELDARILADA